MYGSEFSCYSFWWIVPVFMMILCFIMMRGNRRFRMCGFGTRDYYHHKNGNSKSALEILDMRYASGEVTRDEYEEMKATITDSTNLDNN